MYTKINLMLPTYRRVQNGKLMRFLNSCHTMAGDIKNLRITLLVNEDDNETLDFLKGLKFPIKYQVLINYHTDKPHLARLYNQIYKETEFNDLDTLVSMVGDDMEWRTAGYDIAILEAINRMNGLGVIWCNDNYLQGSKLAVNLFTTRKVVEMTEHPFMCDYFPSYFIDTVWTRFAKKAKIDNYLKDVTLKHHHFTRNPKAIDLTSRRLKQVTMSFKSGYKITDAYVAELLREFKKRI